LCNLKKRIVAYLYRAKAMEAARIDDLSTARALLSIAIDQIEDEAIKRLHDDLCHFIEIQKRLDYIKVDVHLRGSENIEISETRKMIEEYDFVSYEFERPVEMKRLWLRAREELSEIGDEVRKGKEQKLKEEKASQGAMEQEKKKRNRTQIIFSIIGSFGLSMTLLAVILFLIFLFPRVQQDIVCNSPNLEIKISYPVYAANKDNEEIEIFVTNKSSSDLKATILVMFHGPAQIHLSGSQHSNKLQYENLGSGEQRKGEISFSIDEPYQFWSAPSQYTNFSIASDNQGNYCTPENLHIAVSPINNLRGLANGFSIIVVPSLLILFRDSIFSWVKEKFTQKEKKTI
jgi:hypothetical protein